MRLSSSVLAIAACLAGARASADTPRPADAQRDRTKIVRVERARAAGRSFLFCDVRNDEAQCVGSEPPHAGDRIEVIDDHERVAELRVRGDARPTRDPSCTIMWSVPYEVERGAIDPNHSLQLTGLVGVGVAPTGHRIGGGYNTSGNNKIPASANGGNADENVMIGVDRDGDNDMDVAVTLFTCSGITSPQMRYGGDFCVNIWTIEHDKYTRVQQITSQQLQPCLK